MKRFILSLFVIFSCSFSFLVQAFPAQSKFKITGSATTATGFCAPLSNPNLYDTQALACSSLASGSAPTLPYSTSSVYTTTRCKVINYNSGSISSTYYCVYPESSCPANSTLSNGSCTCNAGMNEFTINGVTSCEPACNLTTHEVINGSCTLKCLNSEVRNAQGVCEPKPPRNCIANRLFNYYSEHTAPNGYAKPAQNSVCDGGCIGVIERPLIIGTLSDGTGTNCYGDATKAINVTQQVYCANVYRETGEACFVASPLSKNPYTPPSDSLKSNGKPPLNNDGTQDYDGNPATSGTNEPGAPGSGLNLDGSPNNDGNPRTNDNNNNEPTPCTGLDCASEEHTCYAGTAWDGTACTCGAHSPYYNADTDSCTQTACTPASPDWNPELNSCDPSPVCDPAVQDCVSVGDKDKLANLDKGNTDLMDSIISTPDDFKFFEYPDFVPVFNKQSCQPFTGHILGKPVTWDFCTYVEMLNQTIGWLMTLFSLYTMVQIGIKKD